MSAKIIIDVSKIPEQIRVGGRTIKVIYPYQFKERSDLCGQAHYSLGTIFISKNDCDGDEYLMESIFTTFIHELIHCICHVYNGEEQLEEEVVCALSNGLYQVLVDNFSEVSK